MGKIYAVTSGKGGVGKSTVSVGLATAFANMGQTVLLVDMDEGLRCLDVMLGIEEKVVFDLSDILSGKELSDGIYTVDSVPNLHLVPAPAKLGMIDAYLFTGFITEAQRLFDTVIFDFPAGIDFSLYTCMPKDTLFLTVAFPDPVTIRDASVVSQKLDEIGVNSRLILNSFDYKLTKKRLFKNIDDIIDTAGLQLLGIVPASEELKLLSVKHKLKPKGNAMKALCRIAKRLMGEKILLPKLKKI